MSYPYLYFIPDKISRMLTLTTQIRRCRDVVAHEGREPPLGNILEKSRVFISFLFYFEEPGRIVAFALYIYIYLFIYLFIYFFFC